MDDRFNTAAGWVLFSGIIALGLSAIFLRVFDMERPEILGYPVEVADDGSGGDSGPDLGTLLAAASVENGQQQATARCGTCHSFDSGGAQGTGPNLYGVMGGSLAHIATFGYSDSLKAKGGVWDWEAMNAWLLNPKAYIPGTTMGFAGLKNNEQRADILVYLNSLGSNLPLPAPAPEETVPEEGVDGAAEGPGAIEGGDPSAVEAAGAMGSAQPVVGTGTTNPVE